MAVRSPELKQSVRAQFTPAAADYARAAVHAAGPDLAALIEAADPSGDELVLDVGTGAGHTALAFAARGARVEALDLTEAMLDQVRSAAEARGLSDLRTRLGDAEALPYPDEHFDLVSCRLCAHHFPDAARAASEMARVLRPGGTLLLSDSISPEEPALDTFLNAIEVLRDPSHVRNHSLSQWCAMFEAAGLVDVDLLGRFACPLEFDEWVARQRTPPDACEGLRFLFRAAAREALDAFRVEDGGDRFALELALVRARKPGA